ncbi:hypothetical protein GCM10027289_08440 [Tsukamurella serpentis]
MQLTGHAKVHEASLQQDWVMTWGMDVPSGRGRPHVEDRPARAGPFGPPSRTAGWLRGYCAA